MPQNTSTNKFCSLQSFSSSQFNFTAIWVLTFWQKVHHINLNIVTWETWDCMHLYYIWIIWHPPHQKLTTSHTHQTDTAYNIGHWPHHVSKKDIDHTGYWPHHVDIEHNRFFTRLVVNVWCDECLVWSMSYFSPGFCCLMWSISVAISYWGTWLL